MKIVKLDQKLIPDFINLLKEIDSETNFLYFSKDQRSQDSLLYQTFLNNPDNITLIALHSQKPVGYMIAQRATQPKKRHNFNLSTGVLKEYKRKGIAQKLFLKTEQEILKHGNAKLISYIRTDNQPSIRLATQLNFKIEGILRQNIFSNGVYHDEALLTKWVES